MEATVNTILRQLAANGCPITEQRRSLVELVLSQERLFGAEEILAEARRRGASPGRATVFRTLDLLVRLGYVGRVSDGGRQAYVVCGPEHHHHLVCSGCGQVLHIAGCPIDGYLRELEVNTGFQVVGHRLEVGGLCAVCRSAER